MRKRQNDAEWCCTIFASKESSSSWLNTCLYSEHVWNIKYLCGQNSQRKCPDHYFWKVTIIWVYFTELYCSSIFGTFYFANVTDGLISWWTPFPACFPSLFFEIFKNVFWLFETLSTHFILLWEISIHPFLSFIEAFSSWIIVLTFLSYGLTPICFLLKNWLKKCFYWIWLIFMI